MRWDPESEWRWSEKYATQMAVDVIASGASTRQEMAVALGQFVRGGVLV